VQTRRAPRHDVQVDVETETKLLVSAMHRQDGGSLYQRGQRDRDLPVEPGRAAAAPG
jgi:hypothetical protein